MSKHKHLCDNLKDNFVMLELETVLEGKLQAVPVLELLIAGLSCALMKIVSIKNVKHFWL